MRFNFYNKEGGFTIIEMAVVLGIFTLIIGSAVDVFVSMMVQQRRILADQELLNQVSYAQEYMSKALRMAVKSTNASCLGGSGRIYLLTHCNGGATEACNGVKFINQSDNNACQEFFLDITNPQKPILKQIKNNEDPQNILSDNIKIKYAKFILNGDKALRTALAADATQPRISILLDVETLVSGLGKEKIVQTTISQRNINK